MERSRITIYGLYTSLVSNNYFTDIFQTYKTITVLVRYYASYVNVMIPIGSLYVLIKSMRFQYM